MKKTKEDTESILEEILSIQNHFDFKPRKICEMMNMQTGTFRNNLSKSCPTNYFKKIDLINLKEGIKKLYENYK